MDIGWGSPSRMGARDIFERPYRMWRVQARVVEEGVGAFEGNGRDTMGGGCAMRGCTRGG